MAIEHEGRIYYCLCDMTFQEDKNNSEKCEELGRREIELEPRISLKMGPLCKECDKVMWTYRKQRQLGQEIVYIPIPEELMDLYTRVKIPNPNDDLLTPLSEYERELL